MDRKIKLNRLAAAVALSLLCAMPAAGQARSEALPWSEGFDVQPGEFPPEGWTIFSSVKDNAHNWGDALGQGYGVLVTSGTNCAHYGLDLYVPSFFYPQDAWLVSPKISIPAEGDIELKFKSYINFYSDYDLGKNSVLVSTTEPAGKKNFTEVWQLEQGKQQAAWVETKVKLNEYRGKDIYVAFRYQSSGSDGTDGKWAHEWALDDVSITAGTSAVINATTAELEQGVKIRTAGTRAEITVPEGAEAAVCSISGTAVKRLTAGSGTRLAFRGNPGVYVLKVTHNGHAVNQKFILR